MPPHGRPDLNQTRDRRRAMAEFDTLPPALRGWLAGARLQWSPGSARRAWRTALIRSFGRTRAALARMDALEDRILAGERDPRRDG